MSLIRVANAAGFWGDWLEAPRRTVESAEVDYLTLEYLAELTLSVLAHQRSHDPQAGFVTDFPLVLRSLIPALRQQPNLNIITNAGGMNPASCARETARILSEQGMADVPIGVVTGDDLLSRREELAKVGEVFQHMETGEPLGQCAENVVCINAYLGATGITQACQQNARIVITGRCADASLTVAPAMHELGWSPDNWDSLAQATVAGHLIECGAQATGGMFSDWSESMSLSDVGYPIAEISHDGNVVITKPAGTQGQVTKATLSEQLIYEIGDPANYLTPDVAADFTNVRLIEENANRVQVTGAKGQAQPERFKVSLAYRDGYAVSAMIVVCGRKAESKARMCGEMILDRLRLAECSPRMSNVEILGSGDSLPGIWPQDSASSPGEVVLRISARDPNRETLERLTRELAPLVTSGPPGVTGYTGPRAKPYPVLSFWPTTIGRELIQPEVHVLSAKEWLT